MQKRFLQLPESSAYKSILIFPLLISHNDRVRNALKATPPVLHEADARKQSAPGVSKFSRGGGGLWPAWPRPFQARARPAMAATRVRTHPAARGPAPGSGGNPAPSTNASRRHDICGATERFPSVHEKRARSRLSARMVRKVAKRSRLAGGPRPMGLVVFVHQLFFAP